MLRRKLRPLPPAATFAAMHEQSSATPRDAARLSPPARLVCFGAPPSPAHVDLIARPVSWRTTRGLLAVAIGVGLAPVAAIVPPHLPWAAASLLGGAVIARNRFREAYTLRGVTGTCPRCAAPVHLASRRRLKAPESVSCNGCGETLLLEVDLPGG